MDRLISLLTHYGYLVLFPLAIIEGPILSVIAGLLCAINVLSPFMVLPLIVCGDVVGDSSYYGLGWWQRRKLPPRALRGFIPSAQKMEKVKAYFEANPVKTIFLAKVILGVGVAGLYMTGKAKIPYKKFLLSCLGASLIQCTIYVLLGFLFGAAYQRIGSLLNGFATFTILAALAAILFYFIQSRLKKL